MLEILVSLAILVVVLSVLFDAYTSNLEAIQIARDSADISQSARAALKRMRQDLTSAYTFAPYESLSESGLGFRITNKKTRGRHADRLDFTGLTHLDFSEAESPLDLCEVGYFLKEDESGNRFILFRRDDPSTDGDITAGGIVMELARNVTEFDIAAIDPDGQSHEFWPVIGADPRILPLMIVIRIGFADKDGRETTFTTSVHPALSVATVQTTRP